MKLLYCILVTLMFLFHSHIHKDWQLFCYPYRFNAILKVKYHICHPQKYNNNILKWSIVFMTLILAITGLSISWQQTIYFIKSFVLDMLSCLLKCQTVIIIKALGVLGQRVFLKLSFFIDLEASMWTLVAWEIIQVNINEFSIYAFFQTTSQSLKSHVHGMIIFYIIIYFLL